MIPKLRRRELLKQTRRLYQDSAAIPAVHPRYGHIYHELYDTPDSGEGEHHSGSFFAKLMLAVFLFLSFVYIEQNHLNRQISAAHRSSTRFRKKFPEMEWISSVGSSFTEIMDTLVFMLMF